jgi:hypothetical protein
MDSKFQWSTYESLTGTGDDGILPGHYFFEQNVTPRARMEGTSGGDCQGMHFYMAHLVEY